MPAVRCLVFRVWLLGTVITVACSAIAQDTPSRAEKIRSKYAKFEYHIPVRDGAKLFTACYIPYDAGPAKTYPMLLMRTPYSVGPYGADQYRSSLGPSEAFEDAGYIFVFQDVRGRYLSEGEFINMRPHIADKSLGQVDESSDTYDTIEWLIHNVDFNTGRVGQWGISYPGFYTSAGAIDSHPALKCISPQAPIADWFWDDMHRNGAFNIQLAVTFFSSFGQSRPTPSLERHTSLDLKTDDAYQFYLDMGPLKNVNQLHFNDRVAFWNEIVEHPNYDAFWQSRNILPHLKNINCACLVVGGWFDTEDLYGPLKTYRAIEQNNLGVENRLVMGPWYHGGWNGSDGAALGEARFDWATAKWYREQVEYPFFQFHLKGGDEPRIAEATVFETGANRWRRFDTWPPRATESKALYLAPEEQLTWQEPSIDTVLESARDSYISDPRKPVPYTTEITSRWARDYMAEDQRFAARRPDVLVYRSPILESDITLAGPLTADMWFSTTGSDADLVVKLIDEFPGRIENGSSNPPPDFQSGRQQLVRGQVMRLRFRNSFEQPQPLESGQVENVQFELHDVLHTFQRGHRIMLQVQSTWFPFIDRNPQKFVPNIFAADDSDYIPATHTIHRSSQHPSRVLCQVLIP